MFVKRDCLEITGRDAYHQIYHPSKFDNNVTFHPTDYSGNNITIYSRTSRRRQPKMSILGGRLREVVDQNQILPHWHMVSAGTCPMRPFPSKPML